MHAGEMWEGYKHAAEVLGVPEHELEIIRQSIAWFEAFAASADAADRERENA